MTPLYGALYGAFYGALRSAEDGGAPKGGFAPPLWRTPSLSVAAYGAGYGANGAKTSPPLSMRQPEGFFSFVKEGQRFDFIGYEPYARRDGTTIMVMRLGTSCFDCNAPMIITPKIPLDVDRLSRRCQVCKAPGKPVRRRTPRRR